MRRQCHFHRRVDIEPLGMMVRLFGLEGHSTHETPRLIKVSKHVGLVNRVAIWQLESVECK